MLILDMFTQNTEYSTRTQVYNCSPIICFGLKKSNEHYKSLKYFFSFMGAAYHL